MASINNNISINNEETELYISESGMWKNISFLEEGERQRRIEDHNESVLRKNNAMKASDTMRSENLTIKARLIKRPIVKKAQKMFEAAKTAPAMASKYAHNIQETIAEKASSAIHIAADSTRNALPTMDGAKSAAYHALDMAKDTAIHAKDMAKDTAIHAKDSATHAAAPIAEKSSSALNNALESANTYMNALLVRANSFKDNLLNKLPSFGEGNIEIITLSQIKLLEEAERQRRIAEDNSNFARANAKRISQLISYAGQSNSFKLRSNKGFSKFVSLAEEGERNRRLANKFEGESRRFNARKISDQILQANLEWKSKAKGFKSIHQDNAFEHKYFRELEEKERSFRMKNKKAEANARNEAKLIENIGSPFFHPRTIAMEKKQAILETPFSPSAQRAAF